jgi:hypothetical protein
MRYEKGTYLEMMFAPVTLAKMPGVPDGRRYRQKPVDLTTDDRGAHMMARAKARRAMKRAVAR